MPALEVPCSVSRRAVLISFDNNDRANTDLVLGIGVTSTYITGTSGQPYGMHQSMTPVYACAASLLVALMASLVYIPWNGFKATRTYGAALILAYGILMGIILLVSNQ